jgi:hypothetical protein
MTKPGFTYIDEGTERRIFYIEKRSKDISFNRWRLTLYYAPGFAATALFNSQAEYDRFCSDNEPFTYSDFNEFQRDRRKE